MNRVERNINNVLSYAQERLWFLSQLENNSSEYNLPIRFSLYGLFDIQVFRKTLNYIVERHEILRTVIFEENGKRYQKTLDNVDVRVTEHDFQHMLPHVQLLEVGHLTQKDAKSSFDLQQDVLLRSHVFKLSNEHSVVFINTHHIAMDSWSLDIFFKDFNNIYNMVEEGQNLSLPEIEYQYRDYAQWQRSCFNDEKLGAEFEYWKKQLLDLPSVHSLPLDKARPVRLNRRGKVIGQILSKNTFNKINEFCKTNNCTTFIFLHSVLSVLISRYSREADITIGTPVSGRGHPNIEPIMGLFVNTLVLRSKVDPNQNFIDFLGENSKVIDLAFENQHVPFEKLVGELNPIRSLSYSPLFQIMLTFKSNKRRTLDLNNLKMQGHIETLSSIKFDLELVAQEHDNQLHIDWLYNLDLFEASTIERFVKSFDIIVAEILEDKSKKINRLLIINEKEKRLLLSHYNENKITDQEALRLENLHKRHLKDNPERIAVKDSNKSYSFKVLDEKSNYFSKILIDRDIKVGDFVGLCTTRSVDSIAAILAILKVGAAYVPLDPNFPQTRLEFIVNDSAISTVITIPEYVTKLPKTVQTITIDELSKNVEENHTVISRNLCDPACVIYTSGSTGDPKGVVLSHEGFINRIKWMQSTFPAAEGETWCQKTPLNFVDHVAEVFQALGEGITSIIINDDQVKDIHQFVEKLNINKITRITLVPSFLKVLLENKEFRKLKDLRFIISSGETLTNNLADSLREILPQVKLLNIYGSTEVSADVSYHLTSSYECDEVMQYFPQENEFTYRSSEQNSFSIPLKTGDFYTQPDVPYDVIRQRFSEYKMPNTSTRVAEYIQRLNKDVIPFTVNVSANQYIGHMTSMLPNFMSEFSRLITVLNQNLVKMETSKSLTFLERQSIAMVHREFFEAPDDVYEKYTQATSANFGLIVSGGTSANITALLCARNNGLFKLGYTDTELREKGAFKLIVESGMDEGVIICSKLAHYSIKKTANILGIGEKNILVLKQDEQQRVDVSDLGEKLEYCKSNNIFVIAVIGIAGATETGTIDPLLEMAKLTEQYSVHFHVDAAWGGSFRFSRVLKRMLKGIEYADSVTFCAHKQLYLPQGISICLFRDPINNGLLSTHSRYQAQAGTFDSGQYTIEGSRPATSLFLHAALHLLSREGYSWLLEQSLENSNYFKKLISNSDAFELIGSPDMNIINYRYIPASLRGNKYRIFDAEENDIINKATDDIQWAQFLKGKTFVSKTTLNVKRISEDAIRVFRVVLSNPVVSKADLKAVLINQVEIASKVVDDQEVIDTDITSIGTFTNSNETQTVPIGKAIDNVQMLLLDDSMQLVPVGVKGDIYISGPGLALGYQNASTLTAERFIDNPWNTQRGKLFKTGDVARWLDNGELQYVGRSDNCVKIRGAMVDLAEVELLVNQLNNVDDAVIVAGKVANDDLQIIAYVVSKDLCNEERLSNEIKRCLKTRIPNYMIPELFVSMDALPKTPSGKVDKKLLPLPHFENKNSARYIPPKTKMEKDICSIWGELLKIDHISIKDDFFALGGHSLLAMTMLNKIADKLGENIPLGCVFEHPIAEDLAQAISVLE